MPLLLHNLRKMPQLNNAVICIYIFAMSVRWQLNIVGQTFPDSIVITATGGSFMTLTFMVATASSWENL